MHDPDASCRGNAEAFLVVIADRESLTSHVVVVPREKRGIQYAAASRLRAGLWNTGSPAGACHLSALRADPVVG
jgi:hypothetical protein